ncbi:MAG: ATP-dependent DNA helicase RecG [Candidatus Magasanikbacteria bacterium]|jgi:ATP-dependent DNA helicase RecG|nr:ATP-dependent DNA helicase RecG [Candidatus Magasanikbacteria bacterium]
MKPEINKLNTDIKQLHSIATKLGASFKKMSINNITDLLWYFPFRYDDLSQVKDVIELTENEISTVRVKIKNIKTYRSWKRKMIITEILAADTTDDMQAVWFRQKFVGKILKPGDEVFLSGKAQKKNLIWQFVSPTYEKVKDNPIHSARLVPIYHLKGKMTQKQLRFLMDRALKEAVHVDDPLPVDLLNQEKYPWLYEALQEIHFPTTQKKLALATKRLKFQELFYIQCKYQLAKQDYQAQPSYQIELSDQTINQAVKSLPFTLTKDQQTTLYDVLADLSQEKPMNRLIEGDVGSGKTVVALLAGLNTVSAGLQVAMMAPTEILAGQHFISSIKLIPKKYLAKTALLTRSRFELGDHTPINRAQLNKKIKNGEIKLIIGTHALIQEKVSFKNLGLVIIDEQHRFGVKQRQGIKEKNQDGKVPHLLSMTATPIPRTLSLTLYGDLDISLIKEKPVGRQAIKTFLVPEKKRRDSYKFILEKIEQKQQVFVVCPLIDESDTLGVKSVTQEYEKLNKDIFPDLEIRLLHGKLKTDEKEQIMNDFKSNKFPILVSTSVIEVGVDIPQATIMLIESAERFGLSQLHQFRGRIGRNDLESFCLLFTTDDSQLTKERLQALTKSSDGFELAELDLKLRGSGEIFGTKQTGLMKLKIAQLSDVTLIKKAQKWAKKILGSKKYLSQKQLQELLAELKTEMHLE